MDYQKDLEINKHKLDEELLDQAQRMMRYNAAHAQAMYDRDRAKQSLDVTRANLDAGIRAELTGAGVKFTEAVVDGKIKTSPTYLEAQEKYLKAEHEVQLLLGAVMAMNARKVMLENLVKLYLSGYWGEPRVQGQSSAQGSTEAAIMRSQKEFTPTDWNKPETPAAAPAYCIGKDKHEGFAHGPFPDIRMALDIKGERGEVIFKIDQSVNAKKVQAIRWWDDITLTWSTKSPDAITATPPPPPPKAPTPRAVYGGPGPQTKTIASPPPSGDDIPF